MFSYPVLSRPFIWAHRGSSALKPENSLSAFQRAIRDGADGIECDLRLSRDHEVVIVHDSTLDRTTLAQGDVREWPWAELKSVPLKGTEYETVPRLLDLIALAPKSVALNLELKDPSLLLVDRVLDIIQQYRLQERILLSSFHHPLLNYAYVQNPDITRAALYTARLLDPVGTARSIPCSILHLDQEYVPPDDMLKFQAAHIQAGLFGIHRYSEYSRAKRAGVTAVFLDNPLWAVQ
jgi:glycerophosphoryl diester phosphodiesterase